MDLLQDQVAILTRKVDSLHEIIEQLSSQVAAVLSELNAQGREPEESPLGLASRYSYPRHSLEGGMDHKDVLVDAQFPETEHQGGERPLSPEIQVQRLTAQLTAAYNRIAALEEQLLSRRMMSQS